MFFIANLLSVTTLRIFEERKDRKLKRSETGKGH